MSLSGATSVGSGQLYLARKQGNQGKKLTVGSPGLSGFGGRQLHPLLERGVHHHQEALLGSRELRDVMVRMRTSNVLLHGAIAFFLEHQPD